MEPLWLTDNVMASTDENRREVFFKNVQDPRRCEILKQKIIVALKTVYDPEIPVDIYELGLIYKVDVKEDDEGNLHADVLMTLTAPGCPVAGEIPVWVENALSAVPGITSVKVDLTFDPPWEMRFMSEEAEMVFGLP